MNKNFLILMFGILILFSVSLVSAESVYLFSGLVDNNSVALDSISYLGENLETSSVSSLYSLEFYDNDIFLGNFGFNLAYGRDYFVFKAGVPENTNIIKIVYDGIVLKETNISSNAPVINSIDVADAGEGEYVISWDAEDSNGDSLLYDVLYSVDGINWNLVEMDYSENFVVLGNFMPEGDYQVMVEASDGFNHAEIVSLESFTVSNNPPVVSIYSPEDFFVFSNEESIIFEANAYDYEDGYLNDSFVWTSDVDGVIGNTKFFTTDSLSIGTHNISVSVLDSQGLVGQDSIIVEIVPETKPDLSVQNILFNGLEEIEISRGKKVKIKAEIQNVLADSFADVSFYDGEPGAGGVLIDSVNEHFYANEVFPVQVEWSVRSDEGYHDIFVVISGADESDTTNNIASRQIYVNEQSTELSSCIELLRENSEYSLIQDIIYDSGDKCLDIAADNIILDCQGHTIYVDTSIIPKRVIVADNRNNIIIKNCNINSLDMQLSILSGDVIGISVNNGHNFNIFNNTITNLNYGVRFEGLSDSFVYDNTIRLVKSGGFLIRSYRNSIHNNIINNPYTGYIGYGYIGFILLYSEDNNFTENRICGSPAYDFSCGQSSEGNFGFGNYLDSSPYCDWILENSFPCYSSANAGEDLSVYESTSRPYVVQLDGLLSENVTTFYWEQVSGISVDLQDADSLSPWFVAPSWDGETELTKEEASLKFKLVVNNLESDEVEVYVKIPGDVNRDNLINAFDISSLRQGNIRADITGDAVVNAFDLAKLRRNAGRKRIV